MKKVNNSIATKRRADLLNNRTKVLNYFSARHNSMTKLCRALFKYETNWLRKLMHSFVVHSNDIPCRKRGRFGMYPVK